MILAALVSFLLKSALLLGAGWFLGRGLRRRLSAKARFRLDLALVLALPFLALSSLCPGIAHPSSPIVSSEGGAAEETMDSGPMIAGGAAYGGPRHDTRPWLSMIRGRLVLAVPPPIADCLIILWIVGAGFAAVSALVSALPPRTESRLSPCRDAGWIEALESARRRLGLRRRVCLLEDPDCPPPYACGLARPFISVPPADAFWSDERKRAALLHEVAHLKRRDLATRLIARFFAGSIWCLPVGRSILARMVSDSEAACDEMAIRAGADPITFASLLVELARLPDVLSRPCAIGLGRIRDIERRVQMILERASGKACPQRGAALIALATVLAISLGLGFVSPVAAEDPPGAASIDLKSWTEGGNLTVDSYKVAGLPLFSPVEGGNWHVSFEFGPAKNPLDGKDYFHRGIDISDGKSGGVVKSTIAGTVLDSGYDDQNGFYVLVGDGEVSVFFAHLAKRGLATGTAVLIGDKIGEVGASGRVTGPHLHYEVRISDRFVDPLPLLAAGKASFARR
jgi:beta-lactamase regulating signal transducer with metallopeptidase domain